MDQPGKGIDIDPRSLKKVLSQQCLSRSHRLTLPAVRSLLLYSTLLTVTL